MRTSAGRVALLLAGAVLGGLSCALLPPPLERWQAQTSELRGLDFRFDVALEFIRAEQIPELVRTEIEASLAPGYIEAYQEAYVALGALPPDIDLLETLLELQQEQLVGFYSPRTQRMYALASMNPRRGEASPVLVHELVHALQHQHFSRTIDVMQGLRNNDDLVGALSSALEGDATLTILPKRTRPAAEQVRDGMLAESNRPGSDLAGVPLFLRASLAFPYANGSVLAADAFEERGGNAGLDALMRAPPLSTRAVLELDPAQPVDFIGFDASLARELESLGCQAGHHNVAGALTLQVVLQDLGYDGDTTAISGGWRGDRFVHVRCPQRSELIWYSVWSDASGAQAFVSAYESIARRLARRTGSGRPLALLDGTHVLVLTPGVQALATWLLDHAEIRSYTTLEAWLEDGCFTEATCPPSRPFRPVASFSPHPRP